MPTARRRLNARSAPDREARERKHLEVTAWNRNQHHSIGNSQ